MPLQYIFGSSGSGKSHYLYNKIIEESIRYPENNYIILVPEQFTMQTQRELVNRHPHKGILNIDVLSFERLAYRVLEEVGGDERILLDDLGKSLVIRKTAVEKEKELTILGSNLKKIGMIKEIKSVISELIQYNVGLAELDSMITTVGDKGRLPFKLKDIRILYRAFLDYLKERYMTLEELLGVLCRVINESAIIKNSTIALDGFTGFTPIQNNLIEKLLLYGKKVMITITIDGRTDPYKSNNTAQLFYLSTKMVDTIEKIRKHHNIGKEEDVRYQEESSYRYRNVESMAFLENHIFRYPVKSFSKEQENIEMYCTKNPQEEIHFIAARIKKLIMEKGYHYRDIAVVSGDMERYSHHVEQIFPDYEITFFLDKSRPVLLNPLIEFIRSLLAIMETDFSYESVFHFLRSGVVNLPMENIDRLENYCIATGMKGRSRWSKKWIRRIRGMEPEDVEEIEQDRQMIMEQLKPVLSAVKKNKIKVITLTTKLYEFMISLDIQNQLLKLEKQFEEKKEYAKAKEYGGIYAIIIDILDKMVALLGDEELTVREYARILDAGFEEARVGIIPPTQDRVLVGDMERTRLKDIKVLFLMGVNDGIVPKGIQTGGILSDMDRELLADKNFVLSPTVREQAYIQKFYLYLMLTKPEEKLYISFSKTDNQGTGIRPSYLIGTVRKMFPLLSIRDFEEECTYKDKIISARTGLRYIMEGLGEYKNKKAATEEWKELFKWYLKSREYRNTINGILDAAFYTYSEKGIGKAAARALYGNILENSITRLECYAACAFRHFIKYGLQLKERQTYRFEPTDMGTVFHNSLALFSKRLENSEFTWFTATEEVMEGIMEEAVMESVIDYGNTVLYSSARNEYLIRRMKRILKRTVWGLKEQLAKGNFKPSRYEVAFHMLTDLETVNMTLSEEEQLKLQGRIDRIDVCGEEDKLYLKIIDYKSGNKSFDMAGIYYNLQLQLMVYMMAALEMEKRENPDKEVIPAGMFYYHMEDPVIEGKEEEEEEEIKERLLKELSMDGIVNSDLEIIKKLDNQIRGKSKIIPVALDKNGEISKYSSVASTGQLQVLSDYVKEQIKQIGLEIIGGNIEVNPYEYGKEQACTYCEYRGICGFDERIDGFHKRKLPSCGREQIWSKLDGEKSDTPHGNDRQD